jgi:hypothetical protein
VQEQAGRSSQRRADRRRLGLALAVITAITVVAIAETWWWKRRHEHRHQRVDPVARRVGAVVAAVIAVLSQVAYPR